MKRHIEKAWRDYRAQVLPFDATQRQLIESKGAFFGGALVVMASLLSTSDEQVLKDLNDELGEFAKRTAEHSRASANEEMN